MTAETKGRQRARGEHRTSAANRQRILDATLQVAREYGYLGTTIPRVSMRAKLPSDKLVLFAFTDRVVQEKLCLYREHCA